MNRLDIICAKLKSNCQLPSGELSIAGENVPEKEVVDPERPQAPQADVNGEAAVSMAEDSHSDSHDHESPIVSSNPIDMVVMTGRNKRKNFLPKTVRPPSELYEDVFRTSASEVADCQSPVKKARPATDFTTPLMEDQESGLKPATPNSEETRRRLRQRLIKKGIREGIVQAAEQTDDHLNTPFAPSSPSESSSVASSSLPCGLMSQTDTDLYNELIRLSQLGKSFIIRYFGEIDCGSERCKALGNREHFHCKHCDFKLFTRKEDVLRHFKWHRKRDESLAQGFLRFSGSDDCSRRFSNCIHNRRQTHYHCVQENCNKVYVSTSDVQMHANSHKKAADIAREGFQRIKATEKCSQSDCPYANSSTSGTTHFHCLRIGCNHSFKNKADMDKHKSHHLKDEQLAADGFKRFMKSETCLFPDCAFSRALNHIHCVREDCDYVLHSTSQMYSHRRRHEKQEKKDLLITAESIGSKAASSSAANIQQPLEAQMNSTLKLKEYQPESQKFLPEQGAENGDGGVALANGNNIHTSPGISLLGSISALGLSHSTPGSNFKIKLKQYNPKTHNFVNAGTLENDTSTDANAVTKYLAEVFQNDPFTKEFGAESRAIGNLQKESDTFAYPSTQEKTDHVDPSFALGLQIPNPAYLTLANYAALMGESIFPPISSGLSVPSTTMVQTASPSSGAESIPTSPVNQTSATARSKSDESWKKYIIRYTANDRCYPLCKMMYKDHYHCVAGQTCNAVFRNKDGVREHARQHDLLNKATCHFESVSEEDICSHKACPHNGTQNHYHCRWTGCGEVITESEPLFRRLEHYKVHEYSTHKSASNRSGSSSMSPEESKLERIQADDTLSAERRLRKRGRPPKFPVADVQVKPVSPVLKPPAQPPEVFVSCFKLSRMNNASKRGRPRTVSSPKRSHDITDQSTAYASPSFTAKPLNKSNHPAKTIYEGFFTYLATEMCPDPHCKCQLQLHYHCRIQRCFYSTNKVELLERHSKGFHGSFQIPEYCACYDRHYTCNRPGCTYQGAPRHFHCIYPGCVEATLQAEDIEEHCKMHQTNPKQLQADSSKTVKTAGIYFPSNSPRSKGTTNCRSASKSSDNHPTPPHGTTVPQLRSLLPSWSSPLATTSTSSLPNQSAPQPYSIEQNCGRPFCKLKRRVHFHCNLCFQGFSTFERLLPHVQKHVGSNSGSVPAPTASSTAQSLNFLTPTGTAWMDALRVMSTTQPSMMPLLNPQLLSLAMANGNLLPHAFLQQIMAVQAMAASSVVNSTVDSVTTSSQEDNRESRADATPSPNKAIKEECPEDPETSDHEDHPSPDLRNFLMSFMTLPNGSGSNGIGMVQDHEQESSNRASDDPSSQKKIKFHSFQPEMMKFTSDGRKLFSMSDDSASTFTQEFTASDSLELTANQPQNWSNSAKSATNVPVLKSNRGRPPRNRNLSVSTRQTSLAPKTFKFVDCTASASAQQQSSGSTTSSSENIKQSMNSKTAEGYVRVKPSEQCPVPGCRFFGLQTNHFHCSDASCRFAFNDKASFEEHTKHHVMQSAPNSAAATKFTHCASANCEMQSRGLHYHCKKCSFWCLGNSQLALHLKHHAKTDQLLAFGFNRVVPYENKKLCVMVCPQPNCTFTSQAHYHCLHCDFIALAFPQMSVHKEQHGL